MRDRRFSVLGLALAAAAPAVAETVTYNFAQVGSSYSAFLPPTDPLVGQEVSVARIFLDVQVTAGDAANFFTDITLPISPFDGNTNALVYNGTDPELDWSGTGTFHYFLETNGLNGTIVSTRFGAETPGEGFSGTILDTSRIELDTVPEPTSLVLIGLAGIGMLRRRG